MTDLSKLVVRLEAETARYQSELEKARGKLSNFDRDASESAKRIGAAVGVALAGAATGAAALVKQAIDASDELAKMSRSTGISTEALSQLQYAAGLSGVDDLSGSLNKLNRSIGEAAQGSKAQADAFAALGVSVVDANGNIRDTESVLTDVAQAFSEYEDGAAKSTIAQDLFGRSGAQLISFLNEGADGLAVLRQEADSFGLTVSQQTAQQAEAFNDQLSRIGSIGAGVTQQVQAQLLPTLNDLADQFLDTAKQGDLAKKTAVILDVALRGLIVTAITLKSFFEAVGTTIGAALAAAVTFFRDGPTAAARILGEASSDVRQQVSEDIEAIVKVWKAGNDEIVKSAEQTQQALEGAATPGRRQLRLPVAQGGAGAPNDQVSERAKQQRAEIDEAARQLEQLRSQAESLKESLRTPDEILADQRELIDTLYDNLLISAETRTRAIQAANDEYYRSLDGMVEETEKATDQMSVFADQAARNMQDAFAEFLFDPFKDGVQGMLKSFVDALRRMAAEYLATLAIQQIGNALGGGAGSGLAALFGGGRATGGPVDPGRFYVVGEQGPELLVPRSAGTVVPLDGAGGGSPRITVNNYGTPQSYRVESVSRDEVRLIARDVVDQRAPSAVARDMANPNSQTSKALAQNTSAGRRRQ